MKRHEMNKNFHLLPVMVDEETYQHLKVDAIHHRLPLRAYAAKLLGCPQSTWELALARRAERREAAALSKQNRTIEDLAQQIRRLLPRLPGRRCSVSVAREKLRAFSEDIHNAVKSADSGLCLRNDENQTRGVKRFWLMLKSDVDAQIARFEASVEASQELRDLRPAMPATCVSPVQATPVQLEAPPAPPAPAEPAQLAPAAPAAIPDLFEEIPAEQTCPWCSKRKIEAQKTCGARWCVQYQTEQDENLRGAPAAPAGDTPLLDE